MVSQGISSLLWFVVIVAAIPLVLWLVKRTPAGARLSGAAAGGAMRTVSALPISNTQRLLTVEVGQGEDRRWLVLGVTPTGITTLHTMAPQAESLPSPMSATPPFAQLLGRLKRDNGPSA